MIESELIDQINAESNLTLAETKEALQENEEGIEPKGGHGEYEEGQEEEYGTDRVEPEVELIPEGDEEVYDEYEEPELPTEDEPAIEDEPTVSAIPAATLPNQNKKEEEELETLLIDYEEEGYEEEGLEE